MIEPMTNRDAALCLLKTTNWNCAGIAFVLQMQKRDVEQMERIHMDRRKLQAPERKP